MSKEQLYNLIEILKDQMLENNETYYNMEIDFEEHNTNIIDSDFTSEGLEFRIENLRRMKNFNKEKLLVLFRDIERLVK